MTKKKAGSRKMVRREREVALDLGDVLDYLRVRGVFSMAVHDVLARRITVAAARKAGLRVANGELQRAADTFRQMHGLQRSSDTRKWLDTMGLTVEALESYLETNVLIRKFKQRLSKKASPAKFLSDPEVQETISDLIYEEWLDQEMV